MSDAHIKSGTDFDLDDPLEHHYCNWVDSPDYKAEQIVFRALKELDGVTINVLHKNCRCDGTYRFGKCDFLVFYQFCAIIIEVDNMYPSEEAKGYSAYGILDRLHSVMEIDDKIRKHSARLDIFKFRAFPYMESNGMNTKYLIFKEDFGEFRNWWNNNVLKNISTADNSNTNRDINSITEGKKAILEELQSLEKYRPSTEAEVKVFRALKELEGVKIIALRKNCQCHEITDPYGKCDFLVFDKSCVVIIEVNNMLTLNEESSSIPQKRLDRLGRIKDHFDKSDSVVSEHKVAARLYIFEFRAFPNLCKDFKSQFDGQGMDTDYFIFKEDFVESSLNAKEWWNKNVLQKISPPDTEKRDMFSDDSEKENSLKKFMEYLNSLKKYCPYDLNCRSLEFDHSFPIMLPKAPKHKFIDVYPNRDDNEPSTSDDKASLKSLYEDSDRQSDYEAEVKVFRALEALDAKIIVLHGFKYTHHQFHLGGQCDKCKDLPDGKVPPPWETDFLVLGKDYIVIIEVKNNRSFGERRDEKQKENNHAKRLKKSFESGEKQRKRIEDWIDRLGYKSKDKIFPFTAYPNFSEENKREFKKIKDIDTSSIIFEEDVHVDSFQGWWEKNIVNKCKGQAPDPKHKNVVNFFLAAFSTDKEFFDTPMCLLSRIRSSSIEEIVRKLRGGEFVYREDNPGNVAAPEHVKEHLGIAYLSDEQDKILKSPEKLMCITGPAGSGKTVVLTAKILQLLLENCEKKVVILKFDRTPYTEDPNIPIYEKALTSAKIKYKKKEFDLSTSDCTWEKVDSVTNEVLKENNVIIVSMVMCAYMFTGIPQERPIFQGFDIFVDDIHSAIWLFEPPLTFIDRLSVKLVQGDLYCWIACDVIQKSTVYVFVSRELAKEENIEEKMHQLRGRFHFEALSKILRCSSDLASILDIVRNKIIKGYEDKWKLFLKYMAPKQKKGHYIYGICTTFHVFEHFERGRDDSKISEILQDELNNIQDSNMMYLLKYSDSSSSSSHFIPDDSSIIPEKLKNITLEDPFFKEVLYKFGTGEVKSYQYQYFRDPYSHEFPAVIVLYELPEANQRCSLDGFIYPLMYLLISRARVKCTVIIGPLSKLNYANREKFEELLKELKPHAKIRRYPPASNSEDTPLGPLASNSEDIPLDPTASSSDDIPLDPLASNSDDIPLDSPASNSEDILLDPPASNSDDIPVNPSCCA